MTKISIYKTAIVLGTLMALVLISSCEIVPPEAPTVYINKIDQESIGATADDVSELPVIQSFKPGQNTITGIDLSVWSVGSTAPNGLTASIVTDITGGNLSGLLITQELSVSSVGIVQFRWEPIEVVPGQTLYFVVEEIGNIALKRLNGGDYTDGQRFSSTDGSPLGTADLYFQTYYAQYK